LTARVELRAPGPRDEQAFIEAVRRSRRLHGSYADPPDTAHRYRDYLERGRSASHEPFLIWAAAGGGLVGYATLSEIVRGAFLNAYLGYAAFEPHAGHGLMREGLELVLDEAFGRLGLHRVEANIQPGNDRSIALAKRLGFRHEGFSPRYLHIGGEWRDHARFAITAEEWRR
jgi:ribosomal-protein-alanine N-acetyltransferase